MAGHSHWKQIQRHKGSEDERRAKLFAKLLAAIVVAAKTDPHPQFNPRLRAAVEKARAAHVPHDNIDRALTRASEDKTFEELRVEAYGPGGAALLVDAI